VQLSCAARKTGRAGFWVSWRHFTRNPAWHQRLQARWCVRTASLVEDDRARPLCKKRP
jgi:hypothetical protein